MPSPKPKSQDPLRILLVEDDELFRLGLRVRLQQEPTLTIAAEAEDGESALALAQQQPFDLILMDVGLPGIGGIEACRQLKQQQPTVPVLILTSHNQKALIARLIEGRRSRLLPEGHGRRNADFGAAIRCGWGLLVGFCGNPGDSVCVCCSAGGRNFTQ